MAIGKVPNETTKTTCLLSESDTIVGSATHSVIKYIYGSFPYISK
jgi:hypothetical protein